MRPRHPTAIALATSLACHATLIATALHFGAYDRVRAAPRVASQLEVVPQPDDPFGERGGFGEALNSVPAEQVLQSPHEAQDQPLLGLLPEGPLREAPTASQMLAMAEARPTLPQNQSLQNLLGATGVTGERPASAPSQPIPAEPATPQPVPAAPSAQPQQVQMPPPTDPGKPRDREVDLFTKEASVDYRAGQAVARDGREFRIRGMRRGLAAFWDQVFLPRPIVVRFVLVVDGEGAPLEVKIEKSTGSEALDQAIRKELFNSWFDPDPSRTGADLGKPFRFTIRIL